MGKTYIIPELNGEWFISGETVNNNLELESFIPALRSTQDAQLYVSYNDTEYAVDPVPITKQGIPGFEMSFYPPELITFSGAAVVFAPTPGVLRLIPKEREINDFPPGFETAFTFSMYTKDDEKKDEDTTGRAPSKNLTVTDFKSSQNMAFRLERVIKHLDPTAKIVDCTLWKLMDILEGIVFSEESSPEQGGIE